MSCEEAHERCGVDVSLIRAESRTKDHGLNFEITKFGIKKLRLRAWCSVIAS